MINLFLKLTLIINILENLIFCTCATPKSLEAQQEYNFSISDVVFIGEVIKINQEKNTFKIETLENFKGINTNQIYDGTFEPFCHPYINEKGRWLIYANINEQCVIEVISCGISRSFDHPEDNFMVLPSPPPPVPPELKKDKEELIKERSDYKQKIKNIAQKDLELEINKLQKINYKSD